ncbi:MAG: hypothetical protein LLG40_13865 [Deltaproteobacteria bacterium]|nr:hypothetical protein [Deltaproteobacteria bacterium]
MNYIERITENGKEYQKTTSGTYYHKNTPERVIMALEGSRNCGERIRLFYGDIQSGKCWNEENDVLGTVGRSMGPVKIPIILNNSRSSNGAGILDHCIVKIINKGSILYRHPSFNCGNWTMTLTSDKPDYKENALCNGKIVARFKKEGQAQRYIDFMTGKRFSK